ncbi:hypothetical protein VTO42DRAFT_7962 [Malbranchea cinnamomea]
MRTPNVLLDRRLEGRAVLHLDTWNNHTRYSYLSTPPLFPSVVILGKCPLSGGGIIFFFFHWLGELRSPVGYTLKWCKIEPRHG